MLTQIGIQGLAIIDSLEISFSEGFNVITGETGAGKSILIKALGLLLGAKASAETVRRGREAATVSGLFEVPASHRSTAVLTELGVPMEIDGASFPVIIRRTVNAKGRSLAWINDIPVTVHALKDLASTLIDVFGQHDNLKILDPAMHVHYLDQFLRDRSLPRVYAEKYREVLASTSELAAMIDDVRTKRRDADYLAFRCDELEKFSPTRENFEEIQALCRKAGNVMSVVTALENAQRLVDQGAGGEPVSTPLWEAGKVLAKLESVAPDFKLLADQAHEIASRIDDLSFGIGRAMSGMEIDEGDLEGAQERLAGYQELFRKLAAGDIDQLVAEHERLRRELQFVHSAAVEVQDRIVSLSSKVETLEALGTSLSTARRDAWKVVKMRIEGELHELAMVGAAIDLELSPASRPISTIDVALFGPAIASSWAEVAAKLSGLAESGAERGQFLLQANPGEAMLPLHKIASGGEVSRIMLALKKGLAAGADTCILVFDEIDTGISGRVADVVGRKMQELSTDFQVICISHLAQVAAFAETHFVVAKHGKGERTESTITKLSPKEREEEVARLLSGSEVTASGLANAKQLIQKAAAKAAPYLAKPISSKPPPKKSPPRATSART